MTAMCPLQFQKQLRLQEARRLLLTGELDTASSASAAMSRAHPWDRSPGTPARWPASLPHAPSLARRHDTDRVRAAPSPRGLVPIIPAPRAHQVRYHGVLAPCADWRDRVVPEGPQTGEAVRPARCRGWDVESRDRITRSGWRCRAKRRPTINCIGNSFQQVTTLWAVCLWRLWITSRPYRRSARLLSKEGLLMSLWRDPRVQGAGSCPPWRRAK
jgi:AraC-like DNA-binding protein